MIDIEQYNSYYVFSDQSSFYLFDIYNMISCKIKEETYMGLRNKCVSMIAEEDQHDLEILKNNQMFFIDLPSQILEYTDSDTAYFSFAPISKCNLRCKYCFASSGENIQGNNKFTEETIKKICEFVGLKFKPDCKKYRFDFVGGGEPLLDKALFMQTIILLKESFAKMNKQLEIWGCTNGTLLDYEIAQFLDENNIRFGVSIDGPEDIHNSCRVLKNGMGTHEIICKNVKEIKDNQKLSNTVRDIWGLCVLTAKSGNYTKILEHYKDLNFNSIQMKFARLNKNEDLPLNENNLSVFKGKVAELLQYVFEKALHGDISYLLLFLNDNDHIGKIVRRIILQKPYIYRCHAARNKISFDPQGNIYPCDSFVGNDEFVIGNVFDGVDRNKQENFFELSIFDREKCKSCWARFVCGGDCYHNSYLANGNIETPDCIFCGIVKETIKLTIVNIISLQQTNIDVYNTLYKILSVRDKLYKK